MNTPPQSTALLSTKYLTEAFELPIVVWPDKRLEQQCDDVTEFDDNLRTFVASMFITMETQYGIGLAAPQVGISKNIITLSIPEQHMIRQEGTTGADYSTVMRKFVMINPVVTQAHEEMYTWNEGCLSVPGYFEDRKRPREITVEYFNDDGKKHTERFTGLAAFAIQHEIDHLHGIVFVDDLSRLKKDRVRKKIKKTLNRRA